MALQMNDCICRSSVLKSTHIFRGVSIDRFTIVDANHKINDHDFTAIFSAHVVRSLPLRFVCAIYGCVITWFHIYTRVLCSCFSRAVSVLIAHALLHVAFDLESIQKSSSRTRTDALKFPKSICSGISSRRTARLVDRAAFGTHSHSDMLFIFECLLQFPRARCAQVVE